MSYDDYENGKLDGYNEGYADGKLDGQDGIELYRSILGLVLTLFNSIPPEGEDRTTRASGV
jgi:hypothetical protein